MSSAPPLPGRVGGSDGRSLRGRALAAHNRHKVMTMLVGGATPQEIARALEWKLSKVQNIVSAVLESWEDQDYREVEKVREIQLQRIDRLVRTLWPKATGGEGRAPDLKAIAEIRQLENLRAELTGTKAAKKIELGGTLNFTVERDEIDRLEQAWTQGEVVDGIAHELPAGP
jgi:hypothetical protein